MGSRSLWDNRFLDIVLQQESSQACLGLCWYSLALAECGHLVSLHQQGRSWGVLLSRHPQRVAKRPQKGLLVLASMYKDCLYFTFWHSFTIIQWGLWNHLGDIWRILAVLRSWRSGSQLQGFQEWGRESFCRVAPYLMKHVFATLSLTSEVSACRSFI